MLQDVTHGLSIPAPLHCRARPGPGRSRASRSSPQRSPVPPQRGCPGPTTSGAARCRWNRHPQRRGKCPRGPRGGRQGRATAATQVPPGPCGPSAGLPGGGGCASSCRAGALRRDPRDPGPARPARPAPPGAPPAARGEPSCGRRWQPAASPGPRPAPARWAGTATAHAQVGRNTCQSQQQNISIGWGPAALSVHLAELRCRHRRCSPSRPSPSARKYSPRHGGAPAALPSPRSAFPGAATRVPVPRSPHIAASPLRLPAVCAGGGAIRRGRGVRPRVVRACGGRRQRRARGGSRRRCCCRRRAGNYAGTAGRAGGTAAGGGAAAAVPAAAAAAAAAVLGPGPTRGGAAGRAGAHAPPGAGRSRRFATLYPPAAENNRRRRRPRAWAPRPPPPPPRPPTPFMRFPCPGRAGPGTGKKQNKIKCRNNKIITKPSRPRRPGAARSGGPGVAGTGCRSCGCRCGGARSARGAGAERDGTGSALLSPRQSLPGPGEGGRQRRGGLGGRAGHGEGVRGPRRGGGPGARSRCELQPSTARPGPPGVPEPLPGSGAAGAAGPSAGAAASAFHPRQGGEARGVASPSCAARSGRGLPAGTPLPTARGAANNFSPGPRPSRGSRAFVRAGEGPRGRAHIWEGVLARRPGPAGCFGVRRCAWNK